MASLRKMKSTKRNLRDAKKLENRRKRTVKKLAKAIADGKTMDPMSI